MTRVSGVTRDVERDVCEERDYDVASFFKSSREIE
jgi:hypothetical protein